MNTHPKTKEKLFDEVVKVLASLAKNADEGCPYDYRTESFASSLFDAYEILSIIKEDHIINTRKDESS